MSTDAWFADYTSGAFFGARAELAPGHGPDWWDGFSAGLVDAAGAFGPEDAEAREWLGDPQSVAGYLFVQLASSVVTVDPGAVRLDRAVEDCQRLLEHLGVEPADISEIDSLGTQSNVLPFRPRHTKDGA